MQPVQYQNQTSSLQSKFKSFKSISEIFQPKSKIKSTTQVKFHNKSVNGFTYLYQCSILKQNVGWYYIVDEILLMKLLYTDGDDENIDLI